MTVTEVLEVAKTHYLTREQALIVLDRREPLIAIAVNSKGESIDDDGDKIDARQLVPWTMALGPFGSWPVTVEDAEAEIAKHDGFLYGTSFRIGSCITWKQGWGFSAVSAQGVKP